MIEVISRFFPIFLILTLGVFFKKKAILNDTVIEGLKKLIINAALPAIFFLSFLTMKIEMSTLLLFAATFIFCMLLYGMGIIFYKSRICRYSLSPFFFTGFEFGMIGVALFSSIFGIDQLYNILLIGLGHEFFIWFFYVPMLESKNLEKVSVLSIAESFFKSPIILAIISSIFLNLTGFYSLIESNALAKGFIVTITTISQLVTPLILLTVGYNLQLNNISWKAGFHLIGLRLLVVSLLGSLLVLFTKRFVMEVDKTMTYAFIIFFLLPPPFIIPVFLGPKFKKENLFYNNLLVLATIVTLILFMTIMLIFGM